MSAGLALAVSAGFQTNLTVVTVLGGLGLFGVVFAVNSSVHSYLILAYSDSDRVAVNVGFYYMANAAGRLVGTLVSGATYLVGGLGACLWASTLLVLMAAGLSLGLPAAGPRQAMRPA